MNVKLLFVSGLVLLSLIVPVPTVDAQDNELDRLEQRQRDGLETYLDRADRAQSQEQWLRIARYGVQALVARWEAGAAQLADEGVDLPAEREALEGSLNGLLEERYARWLVDEAFAEQAIDDSAALCRAVLQANLSRLYETDEAGILYDAAGDPRMYKTENLEEDQAWWTDAVGAALQDTLAAWDAHAAAIRTELLAFLPEGTAFDGEFTATEAQYRAAYRRELETRFQREESRFLNARIRDTLSLRKASEGETAAATVAAIIEQTNSAVAVGLQSLRDTLSLAHSDTPEGEVAIDVEEWQESFQREFAKGMALWSLAEEDLLVSRAEWEQDVALQFQEGEREWVSAYRQLKEARSLWEAELDEVLDAGRVQWEAKEETLAAAIEEARTELARSMETRSESLDTTISSVTALCSQAAGILRTAQDSLEYWSGVHDADGEAVKFWQETRTTYQRLYNDALQFLADTVAQISGGVPGSLSYTEILGVTELDSLYLDDYMVALLGAKASEAYWKRQVEIAGAVVAYANDETSLRPTESETAREYQEAWEAFQARQEAYSQALAALDACGTDLEGRKEKVKELGGELAELDAELAATRQEYQSLFDLYDTGESSHFRLQLQAYYKQLFDSSGLSELEDEEAATEVSAYAEYLAALSARETELGVNAAAKAVRALVQGDAARDIAPLQDLADAANQAEAWALDDAHDVFTDSLVMLGLSIMDDTASVYAQLSALHESYLNADTGSADGVTEKALYRLQILGLAGQLVQQKRDALARRLSEIALLTTSDLSQWARSQGVECETGGDFASTRARIERKAEEAAARACLEQAQEQKAILDQIAAQGVTGGVGAFSALTSVGALSDNAAQVLAQVFAVYCGGSLSDEAVNRSAALVKIIDVMSGILASDDPALTAHHAEIRALAQADDLARSFLSGGSMFRFANVDYGAMLLGAAPRKAAMSGCLRMILENNAQTSPSLAALLQREAVSDLQALLVARGVATAVSDDEVAFRNADDVYATVLESRAGSRAAKVEEWLQETQKGIAELSADLPSSVLGQMQELMESLSELFALRVMDSGETATAAEIMNGQIDSLVERMSLVDEDLQKIQGIASGKVSDAVALMAALRSLCAIEGAGGFSSSTSLVVRVSVKDLSAQFISHAALLVSRSLVVDLDGAAASDSDIAKAVDDFLASDGLASYMSDSRISSIKAGITSGLRDSVRTAYDRIRALSSPSDMDWNAVGQAVKDEYAATVWNEYSPQWFAGVNDDGNRQALVRTDTETLEVLHSIHRSLAAVWGDAGVGEGAWKEYLRSTYYDGRVTSLEFDDGLPIFEAGIASRQAAGRSYAGISRSLLASTPDSAAVIIRYGHAAAIKAAIDEAIEGRMYDENAAQAAVADYFNRHTDATASEIAPFITSYLNLYRSAAGAVSVESRRESWRGLLRAELGGNTLSALAATREFLGVAGVDLVTDLSGLLVSAGFSGYDFELLADVAVDAALDDEEAKLFEAAGPEACQSNLESYLSALAEDGEALASEGADRAFALALRYTRGYLGSADEGLDEFRSSFRGTYLTTSLDALDTALSFETALLTLGAGERDEWFEGNVFSSAGSERVRATADTDLQGRAGVDANERAFTLGLNYDLAQMDIDQEDRITLTGWMLSLAGLDVPADVDEVITHADGEGDPPPFNEALLLLLGSPQAALWILKRKVLDGKSIVNDEGKVDASAWMQAQAFLKQYTTCREYIAAAETSAVSFGSDSSGAGSWEAAVAAGALAAKGAWEDPSFVQGYGSGAGDFLSDSISVQSGRTGVALEYLQGLLGEEHSRLSLSHQGLKARLLFDEQMEELSEGLKGSALAYRAYITDSLMTDRSDGAAAEQQKAAVVAPGDITEAVDGAEGIGCVAAVKSYVNDQSLMRNAQLEAMNLYAASAARFNDAVAAGRVAGQPIQSGFYDDMAELFTDVSGSLDAARNIDWTSRWVPDFDCTGAAKARLATSLESLQNLQAQGAYTKQQIAILGSTLARFLDDGEKNLAKATEGVLDELNDLVGRREAVNAGYEAALAGFSGMDDEYAAAYSAARAASSDLEAARLLLQKVEAVRLFASTGYLNLGTGEVTGSEQTSESAETVSLAVDPAQRLASAQAGHMKAQAALDALLSLYEDGEEPEDFAEGTGEDQADYIEAFQEYQRYYGAYLAMEQLSALLDSAAAAQRKTLEQAQTALDDAVEVFFGKNPITIDFGTEAEPTESRYIKIDTRSSGLAAFTYGSEPGDQSALQAYFNGTGAHSFAAEREVWVKMFSQYVAAERAGFLERWSLAFQYEMGQLQDTTAFSSHCIGVDSLTANESILTDEGIELFSDMAEDPRKAAYDQLMGNDEESALYNYFVAMSLMGVLKNSTISCQTLQDRYSVYATMDLMSQMEEKREQHQASEAQRTLEGAVFAFLAAGFANPFTWPISVQFACVAAICIYEAADERADAEKIKTNLGIMSVTVNEMNGDVEEKENRLTEATTGGMGYLASLAARDAAQSALDAILGNVGVGNVSVGTVTNALRTAAGVKDVDMEKILAVANAGITEPADKMGLTALISCYFSAATEGADPAGDATTAVDDMLYDCQEQRDKYCSNLARAAATLADSQEERVNACTIALEELTQASTEDTVTYSQALDRFTETARLAYMDPVYRAQDHYERLISLEQSLQTCMDVASHPELSKAQRDLYTSQQREMQALLQDRMSHYMAAQDAQWKQLQEELSFQKNQWQASMQAIISRAGKQWTDAFNELEDEHGRWEDDFQTAFGDRAAAWESAYVKLQAGKAQWVQDAAVNAAQTGSEAVVSQLGQSAVSGIRDATSTLVGAIELAPPDADAVVARMMAGRDFASLIAGGKILNKSIASMRTALFSKLGPDMFDTAAALRMIHEMSSMSTEEIDKQVLLITANEARAAVADACKEMNEQIDEANEGVDEGLNRALVGAGFSREGDTYERNTVVDSTAKGPITELHTVPAYAPYVPQEAITHHVDLSDERLLKLSAQGIQAQVSLAIKEMQGQMEKVFGKEGEKGKVEVRTWGLESNTETITENVEVIVEGVVERIKTRTRTVATAAHKDSINKIKEMEEIKISTGEFVLHVGQSPAMDNQADITAKSTELDKYLSDKGNGEMSRVLAPFYWSQMLQGVGWEQVSLPLYSQKLWDDRDSFIKAPTLRDVVDLGLTVVGACVGGGVPALLLGLVDDMVFTAADVGNGMDATQAWLGFGKKALGSVASFAVGGVFNGFSDVGSGFFAKGGGLIGAVGDQGFGGVIAKTFLTGMQSATSNVVSGAINSITYSADDGFGFDQNAFTQSFAGQQALAGYLGGMASTAVSGALSGSLSGASNWYTQDVLSVANLGGSLVNTGIQYGMTGETTFNVLNFADLSQNRNWNAGLLEMHLGGNNGFSMNIGSAGTDISIGTIAQAIRGTGTFAKQQQIRYYNAYGEIDYKDEYSGSRDIGTILRENYSFGDKMQSAQVERLLVGQDMLRVGYIDNEGQTMKMGSMRVVNLATLGNQGDLNSQLAAGIVLGHEAYRNGIDDGVVGQFYETQIAALRHTEMAVRVAGEYGQTFIAGNMNLLRDYESYNVGAEAFVNYVGATYDASADNWKLKLDENSKLRAVYEKDDDLRTLYEDLYGREPTADEYSEFKTQAKQMGLVSDYMDENGQKTGTYTLYKSEAFSADKTINPNGADISALLDPNQKDAVYERNGIQENSGLFNGAWKGIQSAARWIGYITVKAWNTITSFTNQQKVDSLFYDAVMTAADTHLDEKYYPDPRNNPVDVIDTQHPQNMCDNWIQKVLIEAGYTMPAEWKDASTQTVDDHIHEMQKLLVSNPVLGVNIVLLQGGIESHAQIMLLSSDGTVTIYQNGHKNYKSTVQTFESVSTYQSYERWSKANEKWYDKFYYYPIKH